MRTNVNTPHWGGAPLIREVLATFRAGGLPASAAAAALEIGRTRFYQIYADYLRACAARTQRRWQCAMIGALPAPKR